MIPAMFRLFDLFRRPPQQDAWSASAYLYDNTVIVHPNNRTYNNIGWNSEPVATVSLNAESAAVGELIRSTLWASRWDAEHPDPLDHDNPVLQAASVKTWITLERKALLVHFGLQKATITVTPNRAATRGEGRGWCGLDECMTLREDCSDTELGDAARRAFKMCIPWKAKHQPGQ